MSAPMVPKKDFNAEEVLDEIRQEVKDELEAARRESAIAEAEVFDLRQEIDRVQTEALELKFSLKKNSLEYERERATYQHENHELEKLIRELGGKMETLEAQVIVAKRQQVASEAEAREILQRAEAAEENGRFLKTQCELRKKESLARVRKEFEERMEHMNMEHKDQIAKIEAHHKEILQRAMIERRSEYEGKVKDAKAALVHSQHEALILGEKLKAAEARIRQLEACSDSPRKLVMMHT